MLRVGDQAVQSPQQLLAGGRFQAGSVDLLAGFLQHPQRPVGVLLQHLLCCDLGVRHIAEDRFMQGQLGGHGIVERRSRLARWSVPMTQSIWCPAAPRHGKQRKMVLKPRRRDRVDVVDIRIGLLEELQRAVAVAGLQGRFTLLEQAVARRLGAPPRRVFSGWRIGRLVGRRRDRSAC